MSKDLSTRDAEPVSWIGGPRGSDEEGELVRRAIVDRGLATYGPLVAHVAEQLFAQDNSHIGAAADLGFFRSWYLPLAQRLLERLQGTEVEIGAVRSHRPVRHA